MKFPSSRAAEGAGGGPVKLVGDRRSPWQGRCSLCQQHTSLVCLLSGSPPLPSASAVEIPVMPVPQPRRARLCPAPRSCGVVAGSCGWQGSSQRGHRNQSRALNGVQGGRAFLGWFSGGKEPRLPPLGCPRLAAGSRAAPAPGGCAGRATGTQLQMAVLKAWVEEEGGFPAVLGLCLFFVIKI